MKAGSPSASAGGKPIGFLAPEKRQHVDSFGNPTFEPSTEVAIRSGLQEDVYIVFAGTTRMRTEVLPTSIYLELNSGHLGGAAAVSLVMLAVAAIVIHQARESSNYQNRKPVIVLSAKNLSRKLRILLLM